MSVAQALQWAREKLALAGMAPAEARREARLLLAEALGTSPAWLMAHDEHRLPDDARTRFEAWIERRAKGEPIAYLLGRRAFWTFELRVTPETLIPRPETECLVEAALTYGPEGPASVLDLGTGTGAIACALACERRQWTVFAVDVAPETIDVARMNVQDLALEDQVTVLQSNWFSALPAGRCFDLIVSNPPYIEAADPHLTRGDVRFEPPHALVSGEDGLQDIRKIVYEAPRWLSRGGWLMFEHGWNQGPAVRALFDTASWSQVMTLKDLAGHERVTLARYSEQAETES